MALKQLDLFQQSEKRLGLSQKIAGPFSQDPLFLLATRISLGLIFLSFLALALTWRQLTPKVPLFYSLTKGEPQLARRAFLWILPIGGLVVFLINLELAQRFAAEERFLSQILILAAGLTSLLSTITLIKIIFLVT